MNGRENGRGERYRYDAEGQLVEAWYEAPNPTATGDGAWGYEAFNYDAMGNMQQNNYLARWGWNWFARRDNGLNQYASWSPSVIYHDDNYPGWGPAGNGVVMATGGSQRAITRSTNR